MKTDALAAIRGVAEVLQKENDLKAKTLFWALEQLAAHEKEEINILRLRAQNAETLLRRQLSEAMS